jgi:hypothetical protein
MGTAWAQSGRPSRNDPPELRERLAKVLATYHCPVTAYLSEIHAKPHPEDEQNRYLILSAQRHPEFYVQCAFFNEDTAVHCEAASGFYNAKIASFATPAKRAILARLGFSTDSSKGNFVAEWEVNDRSTASDIAEVLIATLVRVFDFAADDKLAFNAPLLGLHKDTLTTLPHSCAAVSGLWEHRVVAFAWSADEPVFSRSSAHR